jgi:two-component system, LytTR family, response regulator
LGSEKPPSKIRTIVVDDEPLARANITASLRTDPVIQVVGEAGSGTEAIAEIRHKRPNLVFLDVQMPECDGFDVMEFLGNDLPAAAIFVTAYDQYALRAFEVGALDYLLKPFDNTRFELALARAKQKIAHGENFRRVDRLVVKEAGQVRFVKTSEIDCIEAADYYACLHVGNKTHLLRRSMAELEQELDQRSFCRVHRSSIVNLDRVDRIELNEDGEHDVLLTNGVRLRLGRRYRKELQARLGAGVRSL